jgi:hypothetical protein
MLQQTSSRLFKGVYKVMNENIPIILTKMASALSGNKRTVKDEHTFIISRDLILTLASEKPDCIGLYSTIYRSETAIPKEILDKVLIANYGCSGARGATLGVYFEDNSVLLSQIIPCVDHIPEQRLLDMGSIFISSAILWHNRLANPITSKSNSVDKQSVNQFLKI